MQSAAKNRVQFLLPLLVGITLLWITGCASPSGHELQPTVELVGIEQSTTAESALEFDIRLRITNPNEAPLELSGIYYELRLEEIDIVSGTTRDIPIIEGFSHQTVRVSSAADMINGARFLSLLINDPEDDTVNYRLRVKLGSKSRWARAEIIEKAGEISLK